jgi:GDPmannose 4,6-dehydratase
MNRKIIITGVTGQDGSYLANFLLKKGYQIFGITKSLNKNEFNNLKFLKIEKKIKFIKCNLLEYKKLSSIIKKIKPVMFFNYAGISTLQESYRDSMRTNAINNTAVINILESIKLYSLETKFFQASSSLLFKISKNKINENSEFDPITPYAIAKLSAYFFIKYYRNNFNLFATNGFFFNHESPLRNDNFVTKKIVRKLVQYKLSKKIIDPLYIGDLYAKRDWGYAEDYVKLSYKILKIKKPNDFIICTGRAYAVKDFINLTAKNLKLNIKWLKVKTMNETCINSINNQKIVQIKKNLFRKNDSNYVYGNNFKAKKLLKWKPMSKINSLIKKMIDHEIKIYNENDKNK